MTDAFRIESTQSLLHSYVFDVERRQILHHDTRFERDVVTHRGAVAILAINQAGEVGVLRQFRAPFERYTLEIPAGTRDVSKEPALAAAQRELLEELGCQATRWRLLGHFMNSPGWTNQVMTIFEARDLTLETRRPQGPEETASSVHWMSATALREALRREEAIDSTTAVALLNIFGNFFDVE